MDELQSAFRLLQEQHQSPCLTDSEVQLIQVVEDDGSSWEEIFEALEHVPEMAQRLLIWASCLNTKIASKKNDLQTLLTSLGRTQTESLLWVALLHLRFDHFDEDQFKMNRLNRITTHSILTAVVSHFLANEFSELKNGQLIAASLTHDIGHLIMPFYRPKLNVLKANEDALFESVIESIPESVPTQPNWNHSDLGGLFLESIPTSVAISHAARHHHDCHYSADQSAIVTIDKPSIESDLELSRLLFTVRAADLIAESFDLSQTETKSRAALAKLRNEFHDSPYAETVMIIFTSLQSWMEPALLTAARIEKLLLIDGVEEGVESDCNEHRSEQENEGEM